MALQIPDTEEEYERFRDDAIDAYSEWLARTNRDAKASDLGTLLDWKWNYGDGRLDRLTRPELDEYLLEWSPRKLSISLEAAALLPESTAIAARFLAEAGILSSGDSPAKLADHARRLVEPFVAEMDNPENFGMAKSILNGMGLLDDPSTLTAEDLQRAMDEFNQLPYEQRKAITDPAMRRQQEPEPMVIGPVPEPSPDAVRASAERAPVLTGLRILADYLGPEGKQLTKTGALKLADARVLVERLGTGETLEEQYGDRTFRRQSARDLPKLDHWQWWAQQVGATRTVRGRLVPVKAWLRRVDSDPVAEALQAIQVLFDHGVNSSYATRYYTQLDELVDQTIPLLLSPLLTGSEPLDFAVLVEDIGALSESQELQPLSRLDSTILLARTFDLLERAGVIEQHEVTAETVHGGYELRTGGKITITPLGVLALINELREHGIEVTTLKNPSAMEVSEFVELLGSDDLAPDQWWHLAGLWLVGGQDRRLDRPEVRDALAEQPLTVLLLAASVPDQHRPALMSALRAFARQGSYQDELVAASMTALIDDDPRVADTIIPDERDQIAATMIAVTGPDGPEETMEALDRLGPGTVLELIKVSARHPCASSEKALSLIGEWHSDKKVAKFARKELFRLRSRLVATRA